MGSVEGLCCFGEKDLYRLSARERWLFSGGAASVYVGQPLDTVKVKMQAFPSLHKNGLKCLLHTYKQDGIWKGLYAGENGNIENLL